VELISCTALSNLTLFYGLLAGCWRRSPVRRGCGSWLDFKRGYSVAGDIYVPPAAI